MPQSARLIAPSNTRHVPRTKTGDDEGLVAQLDGSKWSGKTLLGHVQRMMQWEDVDTMTIGPLVLNFLLPPQIVDGKKSQGVHEEVVPMGSTLRRLRMEPVGNEGTFVIQGIRKGAPFRCTLSFQRGKVYLTG